MPTCDPTTLIPLAKCFTCHPTPVLEALKTYLECLIAQSPSAPTSPDISNASASNSIIITWSQSTAPTTNQVWRSINGGVFALLTTVAGALTTATDPGVIPANTIYTYKIRACNGANCSSFSTTVSIGRDLAPVAGAALSYPDLVLHLGNFELSGDAANLISFSAPVLRRVKGNIRFIACTLLTSITLTALVTVDTDLEISSGTAVTGVSLPALQTVGNSFIVGFLAALTSFSAPVLQSVGGTITMTTNSAALTSISFPALVTVGVDAEIEFNNGLATLSAPLLQTVGGILNIGSNPALTTITLTVLNTVSGDLFINLNTALTTLSVPALVTVGIALTLSGNTVITSYSFPALTSIGDLWSSTSCTALASVSAPVLSTTNSDINFNACTSLVTMTIPVIIFTDGVLISFNNCAMSAATVNLILHRGVVSGDTSCDFELDGGTSAAPSGAGIADKATLVIAGNTVNTN